MYHRHVGEGLFSWRVQRMRLDLLLIGLYVWDLEGLYDSTAVVVLELVASEARIPDCKTCQLGLDCLVRQQINLLCFSSFCTCLATVSDEVESLRRLDR